MAEVQENVAPIVQTEEAPVETNQAPEENATLGKRELHGADEGKKSATSQKRKSGSPVKEGATHKQGHAEGHQEAKAGEEGQVTAIVAEAAAENSQVVAEEAAKPAEEAAPAEVKPAEEGLAAEVKPVEEAAAPVEEEKAPATPAETNASEKPAEEPAPAA